MVDFPRMKEVLFGLGENSKSGSDYPLEQCLKRIKDKKGRKEGENIPANKSYGKREERKRRKEKKKNIQKKIQKKDEFSFLLLSHSLVFCFARWPKTLFHCFIFSHP